MFGVCSSFLTNQPSVSPNFCTVQKFLHGTRTPQKSTLPWFFFCAARGRKRRKRKRIEKKGEKGKKKRKIEKKRKREKKKKKKKKIIGTDTEKKMRVYCTYSKSLCKVEVRGIRYS
jgi:hypothetical protein